MLDYSISTDEFGADTIRPVTGLLWFVYEVSPPKAHVFEGLVPS
jgi:hypothetical protein